MTDTLRVDPRRPDPDSVLQVVTVLKGGGIVAMRTDTVYGLLASVARTDALKKLVELKIRPPGKPFVILAADWIGVRAVTSHLGPVARALGARYWPGPLTLVLPAEEHLPEEVTANGKTVAVRVPDDPWLSAVLERMRASLAAPSANLPGEPPLAGVEAVMKVFGNGVDLAVDGGAPVSDLPSTLVDCSGRDGKILRAGPIVPLPEELTSP